MRAGIGLAAGIGLLGSVAHADIVHPIEYRMFNGEGRLAGGWFDYWDQTYRGSGSTGVDLSPLTGGLGQLTDGVVGHRDWWGDLGNGPAWEWVAWTTINPTIVFRFDQPYVFDQVSLHVNNAEIGAVTYPSVITLDFGADGVNFETPSVFASGHANYGLYGGRWEDFMVSGTGTYVRAQLTRTGPNWIFLSEVTFSGTPIPAPGATALLGAGLALMAGRRRR
ncbi:MAG: hypothetical protein FJ255_02860 [Phycisphaerae bacterium]|nr:hypothetical protein [Phycisphaerae bacterium]